VFTLPCSTAPIQQTACGCAHQPIQILEGQRDIIAGILMARHLDHADELFGEPQGSPRTDKMIAAAVHWATLIMKKVDVMVGN
jgi:hypothetical protein